MVNVNVDEKDVTVMSDTPLTCPCGLDIREVMECLSRGDEDAAMVVIGQTMPFPATLGYVCSAPCQENLGVDGVDIQKIHREIAERVIGGALDGALPDIAAKKKRVAIVGGGPAGLSAAYFLSLKGYPCTVYESQTQMGGGLRSQFDESVLPRDILGAEIVSVMCLGAQFVTGREIASVDELYDDYDAVIIAAGEGSAASGSSPAQERFGLECDDYGIKICGDTFMTSREKVFACGSAVKPAQFVTRSIGQGRAAADAVDRYLLMKQ